MLTKSTEIILTPEQASVRTEVWRVLWESGAALMWCPWITDRAINGATAKTVASIADIAHAVDSDPLELLAVLRRPLEAAPFWTGMVRPLSQKHIAPFVRHYPFLAHDAEEVIWAESCRAARTYAPVGHCAEGLRPHFFHHYLRLCLRSAVQEIRARIDELKTTVEFASWDWVPSEEADSTNDLLARDCAAVLDGALDAIRVSPELDRAYRLFILDGTTVREAESIYRRGKSSFQREAEALATAFQHHFTSTLGDPAAGKPDVARMFSAIRDILIRRGTIPSSALPAVAPLPVPALRVVPQRVPARVPAQPKEELDELVLF